MEREASKKTDITRERTFFAFFPVWVENKKRWFKKVNMLERLIISRYTSFDGGWTYSDYWNPWRMEWEYEKILN